MKTRKLRTNPDDFIGRVYPTNNYGDVVITTYRKARDVTVKFLRTGFERDTTIDTVVRGGIADTSVSVANNKDLYGVWSSMKDRCRNQNHHAYDSYGGRGITVAEDFSEFWKFKLWADASGYCAVNRCAVVLLQPFACYWTAFRACEYCGGSTRSRHWHQQFD